MPLRIVLSNSGQDGNVGAAPWGCVRLSGGHFYCFSFSVFRSRFSWIVRLVIMVCVFFNGRLSGGARLVVFGRANYCSV